MAQEQFRDGASLLATYTFAINHSDEQEGGPTRHVERTALTDGVGFVRQQGASTPRVFKFSGSILTTAQLNAMQSYYEACENRTVFFRDADGTEYEVLITAFSPIRKRTVRNSRDPSLLWYWTYNLEMEIIS